MLRKVRLGEPRSKLARSPSPTLAYSSWGLGAPLSEGIEASKQSQILATAKPFGRLKTRQKADLHTTIRGFLSLRTTTTTQYPD